MAVVSAVAIGAALLVTQQFSPAHAQVDPWYTIEEVAPGIEATDHEISDDGRTILAWNRTSSVLIDVQSGASTMLPSLETTSLFDGTIRRPLDTLSSSGNHVTGSDSSGKLHIYDVATGALSTLPPSLQPLDGSVADISPNGQRMLLIQTRSAGPNGHDEVRNLATAFLDVGQIVEHPNPTFEVNRTVRLGTVSNDWGTFWFTEQAEAGQHIERVVRWDRVSGATLTAEAPPSDRPANAGPFWTPRNRWMTTGQPLTFHTLDDLVRIDPDSMSVSTVTDYDGPLGSAVWTTSTDRIVYTESEQTLAENLFASSPGAEPRRLTLGLDGKPATSRHLASSVAVSPDGRTVVFSSPATNLIGGIDDGEPHSYLVRFSSDASSPGPPTVPLWPEPADSTVEEVTGIDEEIWATALSDDGSTHLITTASGSTLIDAAGARRTLAPIHVLLGQLIHSRGTMNSDGTLIYAFDSDEQLVRVQDLKTGEITSVEVAVDPVVAQDPWEVQAVSDISGDGSTMALRIFNSGFLTQYALFDVASNTATILVPEITGSIVNARPTRLAEDGNVVYLSEYFEEVQRGEVIWDRRTDERVYAERPVDAQYPTTFTVSEDGNWIAWIADGELRIAPRKYPNSYDVVDTPGLDTVVSFYLAPSGRVVFSAGVPGSNLQSVEWYVWDGPGATARLLFDLPTDDPVRHVEVSRDAETVVALTAPYDTFNCCRREGARVFRVSLDPLAPRDPVATTTTTTTTTLPVATDPSTPTTTPGGSTTDPPTATTTPTTPGPGTPTQPGPGSVDVAQRVLDTRADAPVAANEQQCVRAIGADPGDFVVANVTPVRADGVGFGTVHAFGVPAGDTSSVNYSVGSTDPNVAITQVGVDGLFCFTNGDTGASTDVIIDQLLVTGSRAFTPASTSGAVRILNTRLIGGIIGPGEERCASTGASPGSFAVVNVTPVQATGRGFATMHARGAPVGATSNVNYDIGSIDPNVAIVEVGIGGEVCFTNSLGASTHAVVDHLLTMAAPTTDSPVARIMNTRDEAAGPTIASGETRCAATVAAEPGQYVMVNVTPIRASGRGFATIHSSDTAAGDTSNVNYDVGSIDPNVAIVEVGTDRKICVTNSESATVDVVIDQMHVIDRSLLMADG